MGQLGQGRGGLAPEEQTNVAFKTERAKVHTGKGAIIGQFLIDGEQVKGDVSSNFAEVISAAERDASDRINRDRVPRQYQKAVKTYFSTVAPTPPSRDREGADNPDAGVEANDPSANQDEEE